MITRSSKISSCSHIRGVIRFRLRLILISRVPRNNSEPTYTLWDIITIIAVWNIYKNATWRFVPWLGFASFLKVGLIRLNGGIRYTKIAVYLGRFEEAVSGIVLADGVQASSLMIHLEIVAVEHTRVLYGLLDGMLVRKCAKLAVGCFGVRTCIHWKIHLYNLRIFLYLELFGGGCAFEEDDFKKKFYVWFIYFFYYNLINEINLYFFNYYIDNYSGYIYNNIRIF